MRWLGMIASLPPGEGRAGDRINTDGSFGPERYAVCGGRAAGRQGDADEHRAAELVQTSGMDAGGGTQRVQFPLDAGCSVRPASAVCRHGQAYRPRSHGV
ncbi:hypothetical protein ACH4TQ_49335 [Streptomyces sp. NPDC021218]|uniref:hypothetical protein n=1 Tax=Streptomyces sp. NPDC021218 TaxID=3365119 RepID=UPI0037BD01F0